MTSEPEPPFGADWSASHRRGTDAELRGWLDTAMAACDEADRIARSHFRRDLQIDTKPDRTFVTQADTAIERMIRDRLLAAYPDHGLVGEEYGTEAGDASVRWYIDPIDGTHNFIRGVPLFGTLLAVERDGEMQAAVLSAPALDERWWAWRAGGAWARNRGEAPRRIQVSGVTTLADAQVLYGSGRDIAASGRAPGFDGLLRDVWRERGFGDFWGYALVAEGAAEAMVEVDLSAWDAAAPLLLVEEAGGRATDFDGRRAVDSGTFLTTNGRLHEVVRRRLLEP
jgi:histidinol-phosphatase